MLSLRQAALIALTAASLAACEPQTKYDWGSYSNRLYAYYRDPAAAQDYREELVKLSQNGNPSRVPPGVFAELGYLELRAGNEEAAIGYFEREKARWPEAAPFMDRTIEAIRSQSAPAAPAAPTIPATPAAPKTS